jgi:hypothetical protein
MRLDIYQASCYTEAVEFAVAELAFLIYSQQRIYTTPKQMTRARFQEACSGVAQP